MVLFIFVFMPYLLLSRPYEAVSSGSQLETEIDFTSTTPSQGNGRTRATNHSAYDVTLRERKFMRIAAAAFANASLCPEVPTNISTARLDVNLSSIIDESPETIGTEFGINQTWLQDSGLVRAGGWWQPLGCVARHTTAIVIPYRDRESHLKVLLVRLHQLLRHQMISYRIFVVEQYGAALFNKGALFNAAFLLIRDYYGSYLSECMILHDVDLIPEDERNMYTCPDPDLRAVRHMSPSVDTLGYTLPYPELVGGVLALSPEMYERVNGYSNLYRGWGGEDDDMFERLSAERIEILRPPTAIGRYKMLTHSGRPPALNRYRLLKSSKNRYKSDGLSKMALGQSYNIVSIIDEPSYTHITVLLNRSSFTKYARSSFWCLLFACWLFLLSILFILKPR